MYSHSAICIYIHMDIALTLKGNAYFFPKKLRISDKNIPVLIKCNIRLWNLKQAFVLLIEAHFNYWVFHLNTYIKNNIFL